MVFAIMLMLATFRLTDEMKKRAEGPRAVEWAVATISGGFYPPAVCIGGDKPRQA
jgi:hypothetical protein